MSRPRSTTPRPIVAFVRHLRRDRDPVALGIVGAIALFSLCILSLPFSSSARVAAMQRFHLAGWNYAAWALFQPVPSMYNFENRWDVEFTRPPGSGAPPNGDCERPFHARVNHHIFQPVLLLRAQIERCGLPAEVLLRSSYRGTQVHTRYLLGARVRGHGFAATPSLR